MNRTIRRVVVAALIGATATLTGATVASAAPVAAHPPKLAISATDLVYGQPDLGGHRAGTNSVTITNLTNRTIGAPLITLPGGSQFGLDHGGLSGCPALSFDGSAYRCWAEPLAAGETRTLDLGWSTVGRGPATSARVKVEVAHQPSGAPVPRTAAQARFGVSYEALTGTFDIVASQLRLAGPDADGISRGTVAVTVTNISAKTVPYPLVSFDIASEDSSNWDDCVAVLGAPDQATCLAAPLAAGETRVLNLEWTSSFGQPGVDPTVHVYAGADATGTIVEGTGAGYPVVVVLV